MKINCLQKLGKIKAVLQALNAKFQNTRINTTIYGAVCVCIRVSRVLGIPLVYEWVHYYYGGSYIFGGWIPAPPPPTPHTKTSPRLLQVPCGMYENERTCADSGRNIIHVYVRLLNDMTPTSNYDSFRN